MRLPFGSYRHTSRAVASSRLVNCFAEQANEKGPVAIRRAPGVRTVDVYGDGPIRSLHSMNGRLYVVSGSSVVSGGLSVGTLPGTGYVPSADNGRQLVYLTDGQGYVVTNNRVEKITSDNWRPATSVGFIDQYMVFTERDSGRFFASALGEATEFDSLYFATAEFQPDNLVGLIVDHQEVILAGERTMELWYNSGGAAFPFQRDSNGLIELGCAAAQTLAKLDNSVFWLANDLTVRRLQGVTPVRVSQYAVEQAIAGYSVVSDAYAMTYTLEGHLCYVLQFPTEGRSWVFDVTVGEWHERRSYAVNMWRASCSVWHEGQWYVGDKYSGRVGVLDPSTYTEFDDVLRAEWTYPGVYAAHRRAFHHRFDLGIEVGKGGFGDASVMLEFSDDGGSLYTSAGMRDLGREGEYNTQVAWTRLGTARDRVYRCSVTDPVPIAVYDTAIKVDGGRL